ncbi:hypothetical protein [Arthrobacter sp. NEB 688]|uniref:hypothetical protein n=1 Tax=Arthrobacter sp. NEB 688 TaxID=904039 RepID=UPI00156726F6|nr:hypothetical protein [Arthrobacter sp. NEB 688]QKE84554.1 hypothetical protein HL663_11795 [Arthrobacter sp. NEB 688]
MNERPGEMDERDVDERFASIVAAWDGALPVADDVEADVERPTTEQEPGAARSEEPPAAPPAPAAPAARPPWVNPPVDVVVPASAWRAAEPTPEPAAASASGDDADDDEHYEPPAVELPPQEDLHFWGAVVGLVAGPLCLLYVALFRPFHSTRWFVAGLVLALAGFTLLVLRQPRHRDDSDDGARI